MNFDICAICLICICITAGISYYNAADKLNSAQRENAQLSAEQSALEIESWLQDQATFLDTVSTALELGGNTEPEYLHGYFGQVLDAFNDEDSLYDLYYTSNENVLTAATDYVPDPSIDFTQRSWFLGAMNTDGVFFDVPTLDYDTGRTVITVSRKINMDGRTVGVLSEDIFLDTVNDIVGQVTVPANSYAMLSDRDSTLLVHPNSAYQETRLEEIDAYAQLAEGDSSETAEIVDYDGTDRTVFSANIDSAGWTLRVAADTEVLHQDTAALVKGFFYAALISLLISILFATIITNRLVKPIKKLTDVVTSKDLSHPVNIRRKDEIGKLANGFNEMMYSLRGLLEVSSEAVERIQESSGALKHINQDVVGGARHVKKDMEYIANTIEVQSRSVKNGQESLQNFRSNLSEVQEQFQGMHNTVQGICGTVSDNALVAKQLKSSTEESAESVRQLEQAVGVLEEKSRNITDILASIQKVTEQTQLLAINASVEAARAGEAGKGFAEVARQIRGLSDQSDASSDNVGQLLCEVQAQIAETVRDLHEVAEKFEENARLAGEMHSVFGNIEGSIRSMGAEDQALSDKLQSFLYAEEDINNSFAEINKNANNCSTYSNQALQISAKQANSVSALKGFTEKLDAMSTELTAKAETFQL
jgi:methyl-accepting chemotaxis protein